MKRRHWSCKWGAVRSCLGWGPRPEEWRLRGSRDEVPEGVRAQSVCPGGQ